MMERYWEISIARLYPFNKFKFRCFTIYSHIYIYIPFANCLFSILSHCLGNLQFFLWFSFPIFDSISSPERGGGAWRKPPWMEVEQCTIAQLKMFSVILEDGEALTVGILLSFSRWLSPGLGISKLPVIANSLYVFALFIALILNILRPSPFFSELILFSFVVYGLFWLIFGVFARDVAVWFLREN